MNLGKEYSQPDRRWLPDHVITKDAQARLKFNNPSQIYLIEHTLFRLKDGFSEESQRNN